MSSMSSITICPNPKLNPLLNLKLNQFAEDRNMSTVKFKSYSVFNTLKSAGSLSEIVKNYSYTELESLNLVPFSDNQLM